MMGLLAVAADLVIPIHERALRIVAPCPDVQFEKRGKVVAVRTGDKKKGLAFEDGRSRVIFEPGGGIDDEFNSDKS